jgi:nucleoside-diphosphate-sugar epimerase
VLDWQPQIAFDEGVRRTVEWWRANYGKGQS